MVENQNIHWAEDEALLEQYVGGELTSEERERLAGHLRVCRACSVRVTEEQALRQGVRMYARQELKEELRGLLVARAARKVNAYRWLAVAATIVLAVAVWYIPGDEPPMPQTTEEPSPVVKQEAAGRDDDEMDETKQREAGSVADRQPSARPPLLGDVTEPSAEDAISGVGIRQDDREELDKEQMPQGASQAAKPAIPEWSIAIELGPVEEEDVPARAAEYMEAQAAKVEGLVTDSRAMVRQEVVFLQKSFAAADSHMQTIATERRGAIPVRIDESPDSLVLVLYPSTPFGEGELKNARVRMLGEDSLQVSIGPRTFQILRTVSFPAMQ